jgi:signal transduction histidine kinase/CheY-like chemotaxis protein
MQITASQLKTPQLRELADALPKAESWFMAPAQLALVVATAFVILGLFLTVASEGAGVPLYRHHLLIASLLLYGCAGGIGMLTRLHPSLAVIMGAISFGILAVIGSSWLDMPESLMLIPISVFLLVSIGAIRAVFVLITVQFFARAGVTGGFIWPDIFLILLANLGTLLLAHSVHRKHLETAEWTWSHYETARRKLEQARNRNVELSQALDELVHSNRQLDLMNERVALMRAKAEEAQRTKAAFLAKVSHEFRTPLNMIIGFTDLLTDHSHLYGGHLPRALAEDLEIVHRNCEHLASMINDVLDLSQTEAGRLTLQREWGDLSADIIHAVEVVRPLAEKKGLVMRVEGVDRVVNIMRDQTRIRQVLLNLLSNATRYTAQGSITVKLKHQSSFVLVEVSDTGSGIEPVDLERIFEPFFQPSSLEGRSQKGTGLGLSITKQFVGLHEGRLWVESVVGEGSTFFIKLPITPSTQLVAQPARWIHPEWHWLERGTRPSLPTLPRDFRIVLYDETDGFHPLLDVCPEGVEAISARQIDDVAKALTAAPAHAIFVNAASPKHALELVEHLGQLMTDTPVIGWAIPSQTSRAVAAGALDYLVKPITRADLVETLKLVGTPVRRLLIVDDDEEISRLLARMLTSYDDSIEVVVAADTVAAWNQLVVGQPDLVLLDLTLADGSGWTLLEKKRTDPAVRDIPAVIISAQDPTDFQLASGVIVGGVGAGIDRETLVHSSLALAGLMLDAHAGPEPTPRETLGDESA